MPYIEISWLKSDYPSVIIIQCIGGVYVCRSRGLTCLTTCVAGGKSAILTGLIVALGGNAQATNRGSSLKGFVKEGERYTLQLKGKMC